MSASDDLAAFILARLNAEERAASAASPAPWIVDVQDDGTLVINGAVAPVVFEYSWQKCGPDFAHIVRFDPARVLRGVEAKRRILDAHQHQTFAPTEGCSHTVGCMTCHVEDTWLFAGGWCDTVRAVGSEWSTDPAYRSEWAP